MMFSPQYPDALLSMKSPPSSRDPKRSRSDRKKQMLVLLGTLLVIIAVPCVALINFGRNWGFVSAAKYGDIATVRKDLNDGFDPNTRGKGLHAISGAAYGGHTAIVRLLLDRGANPSDGMMQAVMMNRADIVALLIRHGASVNQLPGISVSPLQEAKEGGYSRIAHLLRQAGAKE